MFQQLFLTSALAGAALARPVNWDDPSLYAGVNFDDPSLYTGVDFAKASTDAEFFVLYGSPALLTQRVDPIMAPGKAVSQHTHAFSGANLVTPDVTSDDLRKHKGCSTFVPKDDNSLYWNPSLYFKGNDGSFTRVAERSQRKMYYTYSAGVTEEFPADQDFRMIAGDPTCNSADCAQVPAGKVKWTCFGSGIPEGPGFPKGITSCPGDAITNGLMAHVFFPDCWNGNPFDVNNPHDHMTYSTSAGCPSTHPKRLPAMQSEVFFDTKPFDGKYKASDNPWVLAFGDETGFGYHMDFINGWTPGVLNKVMKTCRLGDGSNPETLADPSCFGPGYARSQSEMDSCLLAPTSDENVGWNGQKDFVNGQNSQGGGTLSALPGCQTLSNGGVVSMKTCPATGSSAPADTTSPAPQTTT